MKITRDQITADIEFDLHFNYELQYKLGFDNQGKLIMIAHDENYQSSIYKWFDDFEHELEIETENQVLKGYINIEHLYFKTNEKKVIISVKVS